MDNRIKINELNVEKFCLEHGDTISRKDLDEIINFIFESFHDCFYINVDAHEKISVDVSVQMSDYEAFQVRDKIIKYLDYEYDELLDKLEIYYSLYE